MRNDIDTLPDPVPVVRAGSSIASYELVPRGIVRSDVVLCHGTPWSAQVWAGVAHDLCRQGHRVLLWDMPGYGASIDDGTADLDLRSQSERLVELVTAWSPGAHLVAHDIGGAVALGAHLHLGLDLRSLHLFDVVTLDPWGSPFFRLVAEHADVFAQLPEDLHLALVSRYISGAGHRLTPEQTALLTEPWQGDLGRAAFYRQIAALDPEHTRPVQRDLGQVRCPVQIGWGRHDAWLPLEQAHRLASLLPGTPTVQEYEAGHLVPLEAAEAVSAHLLTWFDQVEQAERQH